MATIGDVGWIGRDRLLLLTLMELLEQMRIVQGVALQIVLSALSHSGL
jgi:hypothetical protein